MSGSLLLVLHSHLPYVIRHGRWPHGVEWLCEATLECYLPLLQELFALRSEGITPGITISFSPVLIEQLADEEFAEILEGYLSEKIRLAEADLEVFRKDGAEDLADVARYWIDWYQRAERTFVQEYDRDILGRYRDLRDAGAIALQTCGATHGYFPLLGYDQSIHAQIQVALDSHVRHFRHRPRGIWMPECAYRPEGYWAPPVPSEHPHGTERMGIEQLIEAGGMDHTIVDAHLVRGGEPIDWYTARFRGGAESRGTPLPLQDPRSVYRHYRAARHGSDGVSSVGVFPRDVESALAVWSSKTGYPGEGEYLEFHKKHHTSGGRYWRVTGRGVDLADKVVYDPATAFGRIGHDARDFAHRIVSRLDEYRGVTGSEGTICLPFDTELFGHWWHEGPAFIGALIREIDRHDRVTTRTTPEELDRRGEGLPVGLPEGSWGDGGDHRVWLNEETAWTWPIIWSAEHRMLEMVGTRDRTNELEERALKQAARELLLMQASDWQFLMTTGSAVDYATERFNDHTEAFDTIIRYVESLRRGAEGLELFDELCRLETRDRLFPHVDLDHWLWKCAEEALAAPREGE